MVVSREPSLHNWPFYYYYVVARSDELMYKGFMLLFAKKSKRSFKFGNGSFSPYLPTLPTSTNVHLLRKLSAFLHDCCLNRYLYIVSTLRCSHYAGVTLDEIHCESPQDSPSLCSNSREILRGSTGDPQGILYSVTPAQKALTCVSDNKRQFFWS